MLLSGNTYVREGRYIRMCEQTGNFLRFGRKLPPDKNEITTAWKWDYHRMEIRLPLDGNDITKAWYTYPKKKV